MYTTINASAFHSWHACIQPCKILHIRKLFQINTKYCMMTYKLKSREVEVGVR